MCNSLDGSSEHYDFSGGKKTISKKTRMISVSFQSKPFNITVIQVYAKTSNAVSHYVCGNLLSQT